MMLEVSRNMFADGATSGYRQKIICNIQRATFITGTSTWWYKTIKLQKNIVKRLHIQQMLNLWVTISF